MLLKNRMSPVQRGFTLVEVLVVLAIIALMATLFLPRMSKSPARAQPEIVKFLAVQQADAVRRRQPVSVELQGRILRAGNGKEFRLAEDEQFRSAHRQEATYLGGFHIVTFFTDGSSTSGEWLLTSGAGGTTGTGATGTSGTITVAIRFSPFASRIGYGTVTASTDGG